MDNLTKTKRSWNMSRIKGKNTKPEIAVRKVLHALGYRFRLSKNGIPGKPDIILQKYKAVIFVHGCFWHRHKGCKYAYMPKTRIEFWRNKFTGNIKRDLIVTRELKEKDWKQLIVWECQIKKEGKIKEILNHFLIGIRH